MNVERTEKLSAHLAVGEVFPADYPVERDSMQFFLAQRVAVHVFEPIRFLMGCPLAVTNGLRTYAQHQSMLDRGIKSSFRSDHSFALGWNPVGVGALDLLKLERGGRTGSMIRTAFTRSDYEMLVDHLFDEDSSASQFIGQLIWYRRRGHVHVSNNKSVLYSRAAVSALGLDKARRYYVNEEA